MDRDHEDVIRPVWKTSFQRHCFVSKKNKWEMLEKFRGLVLEVLRVFWGCFFCCVFRGVEEMESVANGFRSV